MNDAYIEVPKYIIVPICKTVRKEIEYLRKDMGFEDEISERFAMIPYKTASRILTSFKVSPSSKSVTIDTQTLSTLAGWSDRWKVRKNEG